MNITLKRTDFRSDGIFGRFFLEDGSPFCYTLEHAYPDEATGDTFEAKIPVGTYTCKRGMHRLAHMTEDFETFEVQNVTGHTNILIHKGNYNKDSEGCILVGTGLNAAPDSPWVITSSAPIFNKFLQLQNGLDTFTLTVENA